MERPCNFKIRKLNFCWFVFFCTTEHIIKFNPFQLKNEMNFTCQWMKTDATYLRWTQNRKKKWIWTGYQTFWPVFRVSFPFPLPVITCTFHLVSCFSVWQTKNIVDFSISHQKSNIMFISHFKIHKPKGPKHNITNKQT